VPRRYWVEFRYKVRNKVRDKFGLFLRRMSQRAGLNAKIDIDFQADSFAGRAEPFQSGSAPYIAQLFNLNKCAMAKREGRPPKAVKQEKFLGFFVTGKQDFIIRQKAEEAGLTMSDYLRQVAVFAKVKPR